MTQIIDQQPWHRYVLYIVLVAAAGAAGFYQGKGHREIQVVEKAGQTITRTVVQTVTVEKTIHPDGTVEERTTTKNETKNKDTKTIDRDTSIKPIGTNYSLGVRYRVSGFQTIIAPGPQAVEVEAGRRLFGDIWITGGAGLGGVTLGLRYDF